MLGLFGVAASVPATKPKPAATSAPFSCDGAEDLFASAPFPAPTVKAKAALPTSDTSFFGDADESDDFLFGDDDKDKACHWDGRRTVLCPFEAAPAPAANPKLATASSSLFGYYSGDDSSMF